MASDRLWSAAKERFMAWCVRIWRVRGGGLYALGFLVTFLFLEVRELLTDDIPTFLQLPDLYFGTVLALVIDFLIDTLRNTLLAFLWPVLLAGWQPPVGIISLLVAAMIFPRYIKQHIEDWFLRHAPAEDPEPEPAHEATESK
jgi:hypothetical protein